MRYPVRSVEEWAAYSSLPLTRRLAIQWREVRRRLRSRRDRRDPELKLVSGVGPSRSQAGIPLILCVRNGIAYLPLFFDHYRGLGITRFVVVDDGSSDGTREWLEGSTDVDLYVSELDYTASVRGALWRDGLLALYGRDRWYLNVDVDEFLVFPGSEERGISAYVDDLDRAGLKRGLAPMLDTYPDGPLSCGVIHAESSLRSVTPMVDGDGYEAVKRKYCLSIGGGPRHRLYGNTIRLTKFPVIFADRGTTFLGASIHSPFPLLRNYQAVTAVLLHLKFTANSAEEFSTFVAHGRHFGGAQFYRQIVETEGFGPEADLRYGGSIRWEGSQALIRGGFMQDLRPRPDGIAIRR